MKKNKAIIYTRVSTSKQNTSWDSPKRQYEACYNYCKLNNLNKIEVFNEVFTGKTSNRPKLEMALQYAISNKIDYFIIFDIDRFSREWYEAYSSFKNKLKENWTRLKDSKNIIWDEKLVIKNDSYDMSNYSWNIENPTEMSEMVFSAQAKIEWNKILQRTIPKEILLEQNWYQPRQANYWFELKKVYAPNLWKAKIQITHPIEWQWVIEMFKEKAKWILSDKEIVDQVNLKWCEKRESAVTPKGTKMNTGYMQDIIKNPIYAWIICRKWTNNKPIKAKYDWLVSIKIWNKANKWKRKIVEQTNWEIKILNWKDESESIIKSKRNAFNPEVKFRNMVASSARRNTLTWSTSTNPKKVKYTFYHTKSSDSTTRERYNKESFEESIYELFGSIKVNEVLKNIFEDRFDKIFEENKNDILKNKDILEDRLWDIIIEKKSQVSAIPNILNYSKVLEEVNKKLEKLDQEELDLKTEIWKLEESNSIHNTWFKEFSFYILEHLTDLLKQSQHHEEIDLIFKFVFRETPTYDEIVNRTAKVYPIFALNKQKELPENESSSEKVNWQPQGESNSSFLDENQMS